MSSTTRSIRELQMLSRCKSLPQFLTLNDEFGKRTLSKYWHCQTLLDFPSPQFWLEIFLLFQAEDEAKRQVRLQKRICLVICTVLPLLTTAATLLRLWQVGVFSSETSLSLNQEKGGGCPPGWISHSSSSSSSSCFSSSPHSPSNWSTAFSFCSNLGARLPSPSSLPSILAHYTPPLWLQFHQNSSTSSSSCPNLSPSSGYSMRPCKDLIPTLVCQADNLQG